jgi:hypothetical protein
MLYDSHKMSKQRDGKIIRISISRSLTDMKLAVFKGYLKDNTSVVDLKRMF